MPATGPVEIDNLGLQNRPMLLRDAAVMSRGTLLQRPDQVLWQVAKDKLRHAYSLARLGGLG
jgi:hypothetical protein